MPDVWCQGLNYNPNLQSWDKSDPTNYRGICVSSCLAKLFCFIWNRRLHLYFEENNILHNSQIGFLPENRTADHVFTLRTLIDKYVHYHKEKVYACFVDFRKAFDSVWHEGLFYKLLKTNIGGNLYNLMKSLYCNSTCSIKIGENKTQPFSNSRGVLQGCILSPLLFNLYLNNLPHLVENMLSDPFVHPNGKHINSLLYADDLVILSRSLTGLQTCLNVLSLYYCIISLYCYREWWRQEPCKGLWGYPPSENFQIFEASKRCFQHLDREICLQKIDRESWKWQTIASHNNQNNWV